MKSKRRILPGVVILFLILIIVPAAQAHPLGNFSVNRYRHLTISDTSIVLQYIVDMAEIPTLQQWDMIDTDGNEIVDENERKRFLDRQAHMITTGLDLKVNGQHLSLNVIERSARFPVGQGGLPTVRLTYLLAAPLPDGTPGWSLELVDENFAGRQGWQEIVVSGDVSVQLPADGVPLEDISHGLTAYPDDLLQDPPALSAVSFTFLPAGDGAGGGVSAAIPSAGATTGERSVAGEAERFAGLLTRENAGLEFTLAALLAAFGLGAAHALTPGHGKTIVGAYLVGSRGTAKHALFLGLTTTVTHTAGVFLLGMVVLFASRFILPETLYPWLSVASGLLVVLIGFSLLSGLWRQRRREQHHGQGDDAGYHYHFGVGHTHAPGKKAEFGWRRLLALGVSGGIIPCPSALVVMLSAIALGKVGFGLLLITIFSLGLAGVLTGIGLLMVSAGQLLTKINFGNGRWKLVLPVASASFITVVGIGITGRALLAIGLL